MMANLRAGKLTLACSQACRGAWQSQRAEILLLDRAERWSDVAVRVMRIGYGSDLAYYTLGRAARGMGYNRAAIVYWTQARALAESSDATMQCGAARLPDRCEGLDIGSAAAGQAAIALAALANDSSGSATLRGPIRPRRIGLRAAVIGAKSGVFAPVAGLAQAIDTATLQVHGRTIQLAGIVGRPDAYAAELQALIDAQGTTVRCVRSSAGYTCTLPSGLNVARAALASGLATVSADASAAFRAEQQAARSAHRGLWHAAAGDAG